MKILAVDVSKKTLVAFDGENTSEVPNERPEIRRLLGSHPDYALVCEPTSRYHLQLVEAAVADGRTVFLVNPKEARNYKDSLSFRAKTDPLDARYLYEFVLRNKDLLRPYSPMEERLSELRRLLGERAQVVSHRSSLAQVFEDRSSPLKEAALQALTNLVEDMEKRILEVARSFGSFSLVRKIPGVGQLSACALVFLLESRTYRCADSLVAFVGLDVRVCQSGKFKGKGKITKRGDPVLRHLLCLSGHALFLSKLAKNKKADLLKQKRAAKERMVIAARKILRTAWTLVTKNQSFDSTKWSWT